VADNGSTDDSIAAIRIAYPDIFILENRENLGFAEGNNRAISYALDQGAEAVVILNNDTIVDSNLLQAFNKAYHNSPNLGILGAVSCYYDKPEIVWAAGASWLPKKCEFSFLNQGNNISSLAALPPFDVDYVIGCGMFIPSHVISDIGLMNPLFFLNFEEIDWCNRSKSANYQNLTVPNAIIWHKISSSFGGELSPLRNYFLTRNFLFWSKLNSPSSFFRILLKSLLEFIPTLDFLNFKKNLSLKTRYWKYLEWKKILLHRFSDPYYLAQAFGILHFFLNKFGDCPSDLKKRLQHATK